MSLSANSWYNLALRQRQAGEYSAALASYQEALDRGISRPEEAHLNRGVIYSDYLQDYPAAERELDAALALNPVFVPALLNRANLHEDFGRRDLAAAVYERILALTPEAPEVLARYAGLKSFSSSDDPLIARLSRVRSQTGITAAERASVEFSLGRALDACGEYDQAFDVYVAANRHSRESAGAGFAGYDPRLAEVYIDRVIAAFPRQSSWSATVASPEPTSLHGATDHTPIFVCGMFRSGSTLVEQLLAGHPQITPGGELAFLPQTVQTRLAPFPESMSLLSPPRLQSLAAEYREMLGRLFPQATFVTDKRPDNFLYIGLIKALFPSAKIVHTSREPLDNCLSIYFLHLDQSMGYALDLAHIGHHYRQYRRLMAHWKALFGSDIVDVSYDRLVSEPRPAIEPVLDSLGLAWDDRCLTVHATARAIKTASVWQVREPLYQRSSGRARHYSQHLKGLRHYLNLA